MCTHTQGSFAFGLFGLASQGRIVTVGLVIGGVIIGPLLASALGRVTERRNCRNGGGDGSSEVGDIGCADSRLPATGGPVPRSCPGYLSCQCLAFSAGVNVAYTSSG